MGWGLWGMGMGYSHSFSGLYVRKVVGARECASGF